MSILKFEVGIVMQNIIAHLQKTPDSRLVLVKDHGIYLCPLPCPGPAKVLYADGCDPHADTEALRLQVYDHCRELVGGDDFADDVPLEWLLMARDFHWRWL